MYSCIYGYFHTTKRGVYHLFLLYGIPFYEYAVICLSFLLSVDIGFFPRFWLFLIKLLRTFEQVCVDI